MALITCKNATFVYGGDIVLKKIEFALKGGE